MTSENTVKGQAPAEAAGSGFNPSELLSGYHEWDKIVSEREATLCRETRGWLYAWRMWDLACSPMDDNDRRRIRYGHYLGWVHHSQNAEL